nr:unnamed protein product [Timema californicum]
MPASREPQGEPRALSGLSPNFPSNHPSWWDPDHQVLVHSYRRTGNTRVCPRLRVDWIPDVRDWPRLFCGKGSLVPSQPTRIQVAGVVPCSVFFQGSDDALKDDIYEEEEDAAEKKAWNNFVQSIRSKLTVKQVVDGVRSGAECSFDYLALILTAE